MFDLSELALADPKPRDGHYEIEFSPNGKLLGINTNANLRLIDPQTGSQTINLAKAISSNSGWKFSPDGVYVIAERYRQPLAILNTTVLPHSEITNLPLNPFFVFSYAFNKENTVLALIKDGQNPEIQLYKIKCGSLIRKFGIKRGIINRPMAFNLEGLLALAEEDFSLSMWEDPANGDLGYTLVRDTKIKHLGRRFLSFWPSTWSPDKIAFSPDGKTIASTWCYYSTISFSHSVALCITTRVKTPSWSSMEVKLRKNVLGEASALEVSNTSVAVAWRYDLWVSVGGGPFHCITTDTIPVSLAFAKSHRYIVVDGIEVEIEGRITETIKCHGTLSIGDASASGNRKSILLSGKPVMLLPDEMQQVSYERWGNCLALCPRGSGIVFITMTSQETCLS